MQADPEVPRSVGAEALSKNHSVYTSVTDTNYPLEVRFSAAVRDWDSFTICERVLAVADVAYLRFQAHERTKIALADGPARAAASGFPSAAEVDAAESRLNF